LERDPRGWSLQIPLGRAPDNGGGPTRSFWSSFLKMEKKKKKGGYSRPASKQGDPPSLSPESDMERSEDRGVTR